MATRSATTVLHQHVADILTENVGQQPERADELIHMLRTVLGDHAVAVEHIGSTSVPGLAGRPIPGIQVAVLDIADRDTFYSQLVRAGYEHFEFPKLAVDDYYV